MEKYLRGIDNFIPLRRFWFAAVLIRRRRDEKGIR